MHDLLPTTRRLGALVEEVDEAQLDAPTPCPDYTVGDLLDHIAVLAVAFSEAATEHGTNDAPCRASAAGRTWRPTGGRGSPPISRPSAVRGATPMRGTA